VGTPSGLAQSPDALKAKTGKNIADPARDATQAGSETGAVRVARDGKSHPAVKQGQAGQTSLAQGSGSAPIKAVSASANGAQETGARSANAGRTAHAGYIGNRGAGESRDASGSRVPDRADTALPVKPVNQDNQGSQDAAAGSRAQEDLAAVAVVNGRTGLSAPGKRRESSAFILQPC
jgi:hypothetical protein